jgi:hypothetical protein
MTFTEVKVDTSDVLVILDVREAAAGKPQAAFFHNRRGITATKAEH